MTPANVTVKSALPLPSESTETMVSDPLTVLPTCAALIPNAAQVGSTVSGSDTIVSVDYDGNSSADFTVTFAGVTSLAAADVVF